MEEYVVFSVNSDFYNRSTILGMSTQKYGLQSSERCTSGYLFIPAFCKLCAMTFTKFVKWVFTKFLAGPTEYPEKTQMMAR